MVFKKPDSNEFDLQHSKRGRALVPYLILTNKKAKGYLNPLQVAQITEKQRVKLKDSLRYAKGRKEDV